MMLKENITLLKRENIILKPNRCAYLTGGELSKMAYSKSHRLLLFLTFFILEEEGNVYTPDDLKNHLMPRRFCPPDIPEVTKWQAKFFGYIKNQGEETFFSQLERWMSSQSKTSPFLAFHRYEFTYLTPSCIEIRIKVQAIPNKILE